MPRPRPLRPLCAAAALIAVLAAAPRAAAHGAYTWNSAASDWLNTANWTGGPTGTWPGATAAGNTANGTANDLAVIGSTRPTTNNIGIDMGAAGGSLTVGAIQINAPADGSAATINVGNSSSTNGALQLNGSAVPINGVSNVILANTSSGSYDLRITSAVPLGGNQQMTLKLGTSNGAILVNPGRTIRQMQRRDAQSAVVRAITDVGAAESMDHRDFFVQRHLSQQQIGPLRRWQRRRRLPGWLPPFA